MCLCNVMAIQWFLDWVFSKLNLKYLVSGNKEEDSLNELWLLISNIYTMSGQAKENTTALGRKMKEKKEQEQNVEGERGRLKWKKRRIYKDCLFEHPEKFTVWMMPFHLMQLNLIMDIRGGKKDEPNFPHRLYTFRTMDIIQTLTNCVRLLYTHTLRNRMSFEVDESYRNRLNLYHI